jgi:hypothetical protein
MSLNYYSHPTFIRPSSDENKGNTSERPTKRKKTGYQKIKSERDSLLSVVHVQDERIRTLEIEMKVLKNNLNRFISNHKNDSEIDILIKNQNKIIKFLYKI